MDREIRLDLLPVKLPKPNTPNYTKTLQTAKCYQTKPDSDKKDIKLWPFPSSTLSLSHFSFLPKKHFWPKKTNTCIDFKMKMKIMSYKCYSISCRACHFPSNIHLLPNQNSSSWLPNDISKYSDLEHHKRRFGAIVLSNNGVITRGLLSSPGLVDATAAVTKPVDISVFIQISALLLLMYILTNFVVPQIIVGKFKKEEDDN